MGLHGKIVAIRVSGELAERLSALTSKFQLPQSTVLKFLLLSQLKELSLDDQIAAVTRQIIKPASQQKSRTINRVSANTLYTKGKL